MTEAAILGRGWHGRSNVKKAFIVGLIAVSASILPSLGSFIPGGKAIFGGEAQAACKSITAEFNNWVGWGRVTTNWCYSGGTVTSRHSVPSGSMSSYWASSGCYTHNGKAKGVCITRRQFTGPWNFRQCIETWIFGNGNHARAFRANC